MGLEAFGKVVEASVVRDGSSGQAAWEVGYLIYIRSQYLDCSWGKTVQRSDINVPLMVYQVE